MDEHGIERHAEIVKRGRGAPPDPDAGYVADFKEAREAAELHGIIYDLDFVTTICDHLEVRLLERENSSPDAATDSPSATLEDHVNRSLWIAALITYARCFLPGIRYSLPESLFQRTPGMDYTDLHRYFMDMRNKHIAHSVNALESDEAVVGLNRRADGTLEVVGFSMVHVSQGTPHHTDVQRLGNMASYAKGYVQERYKDATSRAREIVKNLPQDELRKLQLYEFAPIQTWEDAGRSRQRGRRRRR